MRRSAPIAGRVAAALVLSSWLLAAPARGQSAADVAAARDLFVEGSQLAEKDLWGDARDRFERSLALKRSALTLYSLGVAQRNTGKLVEAIESLRAFLAEPSTPATKPYEAPAREAVAALSKRIARIDVRVEPAEARGATVKLDGARIPNDALSQARAVNPGKRVLTATAAGFRPARVEVVLFEGEHASVRLVLDRPPGAPIALSSYPNESATGIETGVDPATAPSGPGRALPFALLGTGVALAGGGAALGLVAVNDASKAETRDGPAAQQARSMALAGDILAGVGLATAAAGVIVLAVRSSGAADGAPRSTESASRALDGAALRAWVGAGSVSIQLEF